MFSVKANSIIKKKKQQKKTEHLVQIMFALQRTHFGIH